MKLKIFCRCSLFLSWSGYGLISTPERLIIAQENAVDVLLI